jgi:uncharacterized membrane protein YeiB
LPAANAARAHPRASHARLVARRFEDAAAREVDMTSPAAEPLGPVTVGERIEEIDVVRGFALLGIFLMNVEFFNRSILGIGEGMPPGLTGADWFASWFVAYFVQGKFWTIFSLLFGMGFAVMLARAERAGRAFLGPYVRRLLALAVFGAAHFIFLWAGDILLSYALSAAGLLVLLYGTWRRVAIALAVLIGLALVPGLGEIGYAAGSLAFIGLMAIYLRSEKKVKLGRARPPLFSLLFWILGALGAIASIVLWALPEGPEEPRIPVTAISGFLLITALLSGRYHDPASRRSLRLGASVYVLPTLVMIVIGTVRYLSPPDPAEQAIAPVAATVAAPAAAPAAAAAQPAEGGPGGAAEGELAKKRAERAKRLAKYMEQKREEEEVLSRGTYADAVILRARQFPERLAEDAGFSVIAISMFLIGVWFVRTGIMENIGAHLPLFRRLARYALPLGIGIGLLGSLIATSHAPGAGNDGFQVARGLAMLGSLPACLGYVGLVVLALRSRGPLAGIRVLAPAGRMALTNYLLQSVISTFVFYGYGAGWWGLARSWQVVYVLAVFALQVALSHWWLARFRYGPMEWLWRAFTYGRAPAMRRLAAPEEPRAAA